MGLAYRSGGQSAVVAQRPFRNHWKSVPLIRTSIAMKCFFFQLFFGVFVFPNHRAAQRKRRSWIHLHMRIAQLPNRSANPKKQMSIPVFCLSCLFPRETNQKFPGTRRDHDPGRTQRDDRARRFQGYSSIVTNVAIQMFSNKT